MVKIGYWKKQHKGDGKLLLHWSFPSRRGLPPKNLIYSYENGLWHRLSDKGTDTGAFVFQTFHSKKAVKEHAIQYMKAHSKDKRPIFRKQLWR